MNESSEIWFELGDHVGENVFLYVSKVVDDTYWSPEDVQADRPALVERYQQREFGFELTTSFPGDDGTCELLLVFLAADPVESHFLERRCITRVSKGACASCGINDRRGAMLVPVPEVVQAVEQHYIVPSLIRLYGCYPVSDRLGELAYLREVAVSESGLGVMEFKSKVVVRLTDLPDAPNQVVEGRSKIVNHVFDGESYRWRRLLMNTQHIREAGVLPFTLHASDHFTWLGRKEGIDQFLQVVNANTCPVKPQRGKMYVITPRIGHEQLEETSENSENTEGHEIPIPSRKDFFENLSKA